jgi:hypothetical protein
MLYRGMDRAARDGAYNNTAAVGATKRQQYIADWIKRSGVIQRRPDARIDLRYGPAMGPSSSWCGSRS